MLPGAHLEYRVIGDAGFHLARLPVITEPQQHPSWKFWLSLVFCFLQVAVAVPAMGFLMTRVFEGCGQGVCCMVK